MNKLNYLNLKNNVLKYFKKQDVFVEIKGVITTKQCIEKANISINRNKLMIFNEENDCTIEFDLMKKMKIKDHIHIEFIFAEIKVIIEA